MQDMLANAAGANQTQHRDQLNVAEINRSSGAI